MNKKPQRIRHLPGKGKKFKLKSGKAALATGALALTLMLASCAEVSGGGTENGTGGTERPTGSTRPSDVTTLAPLKDGTHTNVFYEEIPFETVYIDTPDMYDDEEVVKEEGAAGKAEVREHTLYKDGKVKDVWQETLTLAEAQNRVILRGTKPSVEIKENTVTETLEKYSTIYEECDTMEVGTTKLKTEGKNSVAVRTYRYTYTKGELTGTEVVAEELSVRVDEVILVGTKSQTFGLPFIDAAHGGVDYKLTQSFGGANNHRGLDFAVYYGDPIVAVMDGTVIEAYDAGYFSKNNILWTYGTYVVIQHENGFRTYYAHLSRRTVKKGDKVKKGEIIGASGNTGRINTTATGPYAGTHLHFEIRKYNAKTGVYNTVDPKPYLPWWR